MRKITLTIVLLLTVALFSSYPQGMVYIRVSVEDSAGSSRIKIESDVPLRASIEKNDNYIIVRIRADRTYRIRKPSFVSPHIESLGWSQGQDNYVLNIKVRQVDYSYISSSLSDPPQLIIDVIPNGKQGDDGLSRSTETETRISNPKSAAQGIKTIVIDPGHGGLEAGAKGKFGTVEKDITLDISKKLKAIIERSLAFRVVLSREEDVNRSLEDRAAIANNEHAYIFISIHVNASSRKIARGSETYFLNMNATDEESRRLAFMENNSSELKQIESFDNENIKMILWDMAQSAFLQQSSQLAVLIQNELNTLLGTLNRGVKQAPFKVLTGVACPAVLVEVAFISNPEEERRLASVEFQELVAQSLYRGLIAFLKQYHQE